MELPSTAKNKQTNKQTKKFKHALRVTKIKIKILEFFIFCELIHEIKTWSYLKLLWSSWSYLRQSIKKIQNFFK